MKQLERNDHNLSGVGSTCCGTCGNKTGMMENARWENSKIISSRGNNTSSGQVKVNPLRASQRDPGTTKLPVGLC